ncbi:hypothetical protein MPTK1_2g24280 [Marchantia polymorpha subsp. ruderalis]|uniref:MAGE domain-containing protein n=1 Tax=Marchantia polymorpha TaxID=3197 RepID=A0A2R6WPI2_MARPO|nr:hypothetical protein MARPO_0069s0077 [Marchantia polymorpha]BBN03536.1 hypothetical protein Mp_2g24280 [Marchantia polymorpha subsp. ruderalis]|eukprot:PTQ35742.1 hypothetical protein MARPO_0069s0077 [Marchantia polymorpha]
MVRDDLRSRAANGHMGSSRQNTSTQNGSQRQPAHNRAEPGSSHQGSYRNNEEDFAQTQAILSDEETNKLVAEVMRHMLFKNYQQPGVPVSRVELTGIITKTYKQRYLSSHVISMAQKKLLEIFGLEMKEYNRLRSLTKTGRGINNEKQVETKEYVLRSVIPADLRKQYIDTRESAATYGLATIVIGIIKSFGETCPEEVLWQNLRRLDIKEDDLHHPTFGNVKHAVELLAKQRYIQKEKLINSEGDGFVYELAERALDETCLARLDAFMYSIVQRNPEALLAGQGE